MRDNSLIIGEHYKSGLCRVVTETAFRKLFLLFRLGNLYIQSCLTTHLYHEIMWNVNLMQQCKFIDVSLARHVSGTYVHHQEH